MTIKFTRRIATTTNNTHKKRSFSSVLEHIGDPSILALTDSVLALANILDKKTWWKRLSQLLGLLFISHFQCVQVPAWI